MKKLEWVGNDLVWNEVCSLDYILLLDNYHYVKNGRKLPVIKSCIRHYKKQFILNHTKVVNSVSYAEMRGNYATEKKLTETIFNCIDDYNSVIDRLNTIAYAEKKNLKLENYDAEDSLHDLIWNLSKETSDHRRKLRHE